MVVNLKVSPYNDRFDPQSNYTKLLFNPDRPLQQAELNELQSVIEYYTKNLGDSIFKDGNIQSGLNYVIDSNNVLTVKPGYVYMDGKIRYYNGDSSVQLSGVGREVVGFKLEQTIITPDDDTTLLDQTSGVPSYFSKGADRLKETLTLTLNDPASAPLYTFQDGEAFTRSLNPEAEQINKILAERTYDESGSYKVKGFEIFSDDDEEFVESDSVPVVIDAGKAYVQGFKVDKPTSTRLSVPKALDTRQGINESYIFNKSSKQVYLANSPIQTIDRVSASVIEPKEEVSRGTQGDGVDYLKNNTAFEIVRVWTETSPGQTTKEYKKGTDYTLTNGQEINWSPQGSEPPSGTSYYVSYKYTKTMVRNEDYTVRYIDEDDTVKTRLTFSGRVQPIDQSVVLIDYTYYLARKDLVVLDRFGEISLLPGEPDILRNVLPPQQVDPFTLKLGVVTIIPNSDTALCETDSIERLSMEDLQKVKRRVENVEYNQAVNALDQEAMEEQDPLTLRSVFSEGFISLDKADVTNSDFGVAFSFDDAEATLQYTTSVNEPKLNNNNSNTYNWGRLVTAPFKEERAIFQPQASETLNVNPYNIPNKQGVLKLSPSEDNWVDEENITVTKQRTKTQTLARWWIPPGQRRTSTRTTLQNGGRKTLEEAIEYIRPRTISFSLKGMYPNMNNLYLTFDGIRCSISPKSGFTSGSKSGTIRTDAYGKAQGTFKIPKGVRCGNREVTIRNSDGSASATYSAHGHKKITENIIIRTRITTNLVDPLAQSFQLLENRTISSVGLYFASKGSNSSNVTIQIRELGDEGFPNKVVCAETVINSSDIKISNDASLETRIYFDDPVMVKAGKEYAIVVITENNNYTLWTGTRTKPRIDNPKQVISGNPYVQGVLFSSSNASTWTPHQNSDMKFAIYTSRYEPKGVIEFNPIKNVTADRIVMMSTYLTPENTGCTWEGKIITDTMTNASFDSIAWQPIGNYQDIDLGSVAKQVLLRATFKSNRYISPLLSVSDLTFTTFLTQLTGSYVGRGIDMTEAPYNTVRCSYEAFLPQGTSATPQYSTDGGKTWIDFKTQPKLRQSNTEFIRYTFEEKVKDSGTFDSFKVKVNLSTKNSFLRPRIRRLMCTMRDE